MAIRCIICGRELKKSKGPIGPKCLKKTKTYNLRGRHGDSVVPIADWEVNSEYREAENTSSRFEAEENSQNGSNSEKIASSC